MAGPPAYRDPLPDIASSAGEPLPGRGPDDGLPDPASYLLGKWAERNWRNVPGPIYGALTDTCWVGRAAAPEHISYENEHGREFLYRQPRSRPEVLRVLAGAWGDPYSGWAVDGDEHWTPELVGDWWRDRARVREWIERDLRVWSVSARDQEREAARGLADYAAYLDGDLGTHLRGYVFWLREHRAPRPGETLPAL